MNRNIIIIIGIVVALGLVAVLVQSNRSQNIQTAINSFEECVAAGNPVMESYPEQCRTADGKLFVRDISGDTQATTTSTNSGEGAPEGSLHNLPVPEGVSVARKELAKLLKIPEAKIVIMSAHEKDWPDACLGIKQEDMGCAQVITPGYEVTMQAEGKMYYYRTSNTGSAIRVTDM